MATLGKLWAGRIWGTNTANVFAKFDVTDSAISGTIRLNDPVFGVSVYSVTGTFDGSTLDASGTSTQSPEGVSFGTVTLKGALTPQGNLRGEWESDTGTGGTFELFPHDTQPANQVTPSTTLPEQLHTRTIDLGTVRLYKGEVQELIEFLRKDFNVARPVVTYEVRGNEISQYAEDFLSQSLPDVALRSLKINVQEPEAHGINKVATIELNSFSNLVRTQGIQESWVVGKGEAVAAFCKRFKSPIATNYKKFGISVFQALGLAALVWMVEIESAWWRGAFIAVASFSLAFLSFAHAKLIPNVAVYPQRSAPRWLARFWPALLSWGLTIVGTIASGYLLHVLTSKQTQEPTTVIPAPKQNAQGGRD